MEFFSEHVTGLDFYLDTSMVTEGSAERIRQVLQSAVAALTSANPRRRRTISVSFFLV